MNRACFCFYLKPSSSRQLVLSVTVCGCLRKNTATLQRDLLALCDFVRLDDWGTTRSSITKARSETFLLEILGDSVLLCPYYLLLGWRKGTHKFWICGPKSCLGPRWGSNRSSTSSEHFQYKRGQITAKATPEWKGTSNGQSHLSLIVAFSCSYAFVPPKGSGSIIDKETFLKIYICMSVDMHSNLPPVPFDTLSQA